MADMRDALKKAGAVNEKQVRQAKHEDRVHRKQSGAEGLEAERRRKGEELAAEQARRKRSDAERERERRAQQEAESRRVRLEHLLRTHDLAAQEAGPHRFYFSLSHGEVAFVDVSDALARRLAQGDAAIVDGAGLLERDFGIIPGKVAVECQAIERSRILLWNARG